MRTRILYTNGKRTLDLFWVKHEGSDVYCGPSGIDWKRSYHRSGKVHLVRLGERMEEQWRTPLADLKGFHLLDGMGVLNNPRIFEDPIKEYSGKKGDAVLVVDSRSWPEDSTINIHIGLLEPDNFDALKQTYLYTHLSIYTL